MPTTTYLQGEQPRRPMPTHLEGYAQFDAQLLPLVSGQQSATLEQMLAACPREQRWAFGQWLLSAEWRDLVDRVVDESQATAPPRYLRRS